LVGKVDCKSIVSIIWIPLILFSGILGYTGNMGFFDFIFLFIGTALISWATAGLTLHFLKRKGIVDAPNMRSSHKTPTPRGGGLAVILVILVASTLILNETLPGYHWLFGATLFIGLISWIDDLNGLSPIIRLLSQFISVGCVLWLMPASNLYFHGVFPFWFDNLIAIILWVWFINLFNFMDGIDGITVVEASSIGLGLFLMMMFGGVELTHGLLGLVIAAAVIGFVWWNWHPAKLFLGDVGSVPLGFLLGWLLLEVLASPVWPVAIVLPLYYLTDATITLLRRAFQGERIWQAHRKHFYQQAIGNGLSHTRISLLIAGVNVLLIGWAFLSLSQPWLAIMGAIICVSGELLYMRNVK